MPAFSKKQQKFMGIVRSIQKGEQPASKFDKDAQDVAKDMKKSDVKKFASTKHKGLPMKKEILGKLKEMIKQELSEYTYGVGDVVKDVNPTCPHFGAQGKVKSVNPKSVIFIVKNKGKNFKPGMELEKSHDQMKKMNESINVDIGSGNVSAVQKGDNRRKKIATSGGDSKIVKEMSAKTKKIISKLGKKEKEMFIDMVDMLGFDQVMADYKRDKKAFKQALKDMSESVIQERNDEVQTGKEYTKLWLQSINLIIKQANGLKGALAKHPIKRDLNKLKAVEKLFEKFIKPAIETAGANNRHYAPNQTELKKYLSNSKFKVAVRILKSTLESSNGYDENSWYYLGDRENKLIKKMSRVLYDVENKMDKANLENVNESINEDGHTDVASSKRKVMIMVDDSNKLLNKLNGMNKEDSLPSWWSDKITLSQNYLQKATNYLLNPVESVNEAMSKSQASELLKQLGGNKFISMTGAKNLTFSGLGLVMQIGKNSKGVTHVRFKLSSKDLYDIDFLSIRGSNVKTKSKEKGVFVDQLGKIFKKNTGLKTGLKESINESKEPEVITQLRDIVKRKTNKKIKDPKTNKTMRVDMFTANVITQVYDAVKKTSHKSKFESLPLDKMAQLSFKMMK
jgi:hypothetical protein